MTIGRVTIVHQPQAAPADHALIPQVVASYATYLHIRTQAEPHIIVTGEHAEVSLTINDKTLALTFDYRRQEWSLRRAETHHGEQTTAYTQGQLAEATDTFLTP